MTTSVRPLRSIPAALLALVLGIVSAVGLALAGAAPASAAARVSVAVEGHPEVTNRTDSTYLTTLRVSGTGFQSIKKGFGGIYVAFGTVSGTWQPSKGGATGVNYSYVPDDESNPSGYLDFVSFPGGTTEYAANGGTIDAAGNWSATLKVPGSTFQALDRNNKATTVNCTVVQCGVITIGAHGVPNANNETFTPVTVSNLYGTGGTLAGGGTITQQGSAQTGTGTTQAGGTAASGASSPTAAATPGATATSRATSRPTASAAPTTDTPTATPSAVAAAATDATASGGIDPTVLRIVLGGLSALVVAVAALVVIAIVHSRRAAKRAAAEPPTA
ncbi:hypothetical protein [Curtobacterium sp. ME12]|uniref:hypothetical protein n=1 Tax=Curtobacterium sp. ME12 TaxID=2744253 RepID=UPI0015F77A82|nr:hypothetical protein [Curtobacterium sp. ME12]